MTTPEEARQKEIAACDQILSASWLAQRYIGPEGRRLANANRRYWQNAETSALSTLAGFLDNEPTRGAPEPDDAAAILLLEATLADLQAELEQRKVARS